MNKLKYPFYITIKFFILCVFLTNSAGVLAQNFVSSNTELALVGEFDFSSSSSWETSKTSTPGFYTWVNNAENYSGASDANHINGYVKKIGNQGFVFPVGSGSDLRTLQISAPSSTTSEYAVAWLVGNPDTTPDPTNSNQLHTTTAVSGTIKAVSSVGQWDWLPVNGTGEGLTVTVSIPALSGDMFTNPADLRLVGWNGASWVNLGTSGATGLTENSTLSGTMIAGIQAIGIGSIKSTITIVFQPIYTVVQNPDRTLTVFGLAEKNGTVTITFPDNTSITVVADNQGLFGPVTTLMPQALKGEVKAVVVNTNGQSSVEVIVKYETTIPIENVSVSEAFTPNGDGINDTWQILDLDKFPNTTVRVFNRWGHLVFSAKNYKNDWAGNYNDFNSILPESSSYYYQIDYSTDGSIDKEGWLYIRK